MHERDAEMLGELVEAVYASGNKRCVELVERLRLGALSSGHRELVAAAKLRAQPLDVDLRDPNPTAFPIPGAKPGQLGFPSKRQAA